MVALRQARGVFAGVGVTGSLVAAALIGFSLTGGVLAFHGWPAAPRATIDSVLNVAPPARHQGALPIGLAPAPGPIAVASPRTAAGPRIAPRIPAGPVRRHSTTRLPPPGRPVSGTTIPAPVSQPAPAPTSPASPVADAVETTSAGTARSVRGASQAAARAAAPAPAAASVVAAAGEQAAVAVQATGHAAAEAIRALP